MPLGQAVAWILGAGLVAAGLWRVFGGHPQPAEPPQRLSRRELGFLTAASDTLYPPGGAIAESGSEAGIPAYTDRYVASLPGPVGLLMRLLFFLVEHATIAFWAPGPAGWRRFSALSPEQRTAWLDGWRTSRLPPRRLVFTSLRAILAMGYFADPSVLRQVGLAPRAIDSPVVEADLLYPPVGRGPEAIRYRREDLTPPGAARVLALDAPLHPDYAPRADGSAS